MKRKKRRKAIADGERKDEMMDAIKWVRMPDEAVKDAFSIREEVFVKEQGFQEEFDSTDDSCWHLICYQNGCPTACARLFTEGNGVWHAGRIAVRRDCRGTGIGAEIMAALEEKARELGSQKIVLSAQCRVADFYIKQGYQKTANEYLDEYCPHVEMFKLL